MYKLLRIYNIKCNGNEVLSAQYEVIHEFKTFNYDEETENSLLNICIQKGVPCSDSLNKYSVVEYIDEEPISIVAHLYYVRPDDEIGSYMDVAEWNERIVTSVAIGEDLAISKTYKIVNKITDEAYIQWIEHFVRVVIFKAYIKCSEVVIADIEQSKRIFLLIDGKEYTIRTWSFVPVEDDDKGHTVSENVTYTLYRMVDDENGSHGETVNDGQINICWNVE